MFLEIAHKPFNDGTPRHPLVIFYIPKECTPLVNDILSTNCMWESEESDGFNSFEIIPQSLEMPELASWVKLKDRFGIVYSDCVEYWFKEPK